MLTNGRLVLEELSKWGKSKFGNIKTRIKRIKEKLKQIQCNPHHEANVEAKLRGELDKFLEMEEVYWKQRSKTDWLKNDDRNIKYFHRKASQRRKWNSIDCIQNQDEEWLETKDQIKAYVVAFFKGLYTAGEAENEVLSSLSNNKILDELREEQDKDNIVVI